MYISPRHPEPQQTAVPLQPPPRPASGGGFRINVLKSLRLHAMTASLVAIITCSFGLAVLLSHHATYLATSVIYVSPTFPKTLTEDREQEYQYESYIQEVIHTITRYDIMADAIHKLPGGMWQKPGESEQLAVERLQRSLEIARVPMTYQVSIQLYGSRPEHLAQIVNTVTNSYLEKAKDEEFYGRDDRLETLRAERARLQTGLDALLQEQGNITQSLGMATVASDPFDSNLDKMRGDLTAAHSLRVQAEAQLSSLANGDSGAASSALSAAADEIIATDPGLTALKTSLGQKRSELLGTLAGLTPNHPLRKQTEDQLAETENALQKMQTDLRRKAAARLEQKLRSEVSRTTMIESRLQSDLLHATKTATSAAPKFLRAGDLKVEIERQQSRYNTVDERINNLELESSSPGSVHLFQPARTPLGPEQSKVGKFMLLLFPISMLLGVLAALLLDLLDPKLYTGSDIEGVLNFAPLGVLLDDHEVPQIVFDECALRMAAGIDHAAHSAGARTFVITSVTVGAGTTSIVEQLGSTLAKLGRKTLTVDASGNTEPVAYATGKVTASDLVPDESKGTTSNNSDLQKSSVVSQQAIATKQPLMKSFMANAFQDLTNEYDIVLIDAAPLLLSAETEYLARFADVTILVSEAGRTKKSELKRAAKLLERLNVSGVAAIINKVGLLRAENTLKKDLEQFEARLNKTNLRWKPKYRRTQSSSYPSFAGVEDVPAAESVSLSHDL